MGAVEADRGLRMLPHTCTMRALLLLLVFAAGVSSFPQAASAQNRNTWKSSFGRFVTGVSGSVPATTGSKSITIVASVSWNNTRFHACTKTSTPTSAQGSYLQSGCVQTSPQPPSGASLTITTNVSVTQAMIDNGGFVLAIEYLNPSSVVFGQWVPVTLLEVSPQAVTEGSGTGVPYTVALSTTPSGPVTVTVNVPSGNLVTAVPGALTYSPTNWNTGQAVTVTATRRRRSW